jgi:organic hydroperoxide reductase OsmC/OhrA
VTRPRELGCPNGRVTIPEQLFTASYAGSLPEMMRLVAGREGIERGPLRSLCSWRSGRHLGSKRHVRSTSINITTLSKYYDDEARRRLMACLSANAHGNGLITES